MAVDGGRIGNRPPGGSGGRLRVELRALKLRQEQIMVGGKSIAGMEKLVETADERFVFQAQPPDNGVEALANFLRVFLFEVIVKKDDHRQWKGFGGKNVDLLLHIIFKHAEFVALQVRNKVARAVLDCDR